MNTRRIVACILVGLTLLLFSLRLSAQSSISIPTFSVNSPYCDAASIVVSYTTTGIYTAGNTFTVQLSDATGSFVTSPVSIGVSGAAVQTTTATVTSRTLTCTFPYNVTTATKYRIRVVSSNPVVNSPDNGYDFSISAPVATVTSQTTTTNYCLSEIFNVTYTKSCNYATGNVFTAQLSDASGNFGSPTSIGTFTSTGAGTISCAIPGGTAAGTGYRIRIVSSNPVTTSADNGNNITVNTPSGTAGTYGNGTWYASCYNSTWTATTTPTNYQGYYTENNLTFNTSPRWSTAGGPTLADASSGIAYMGCPFSANGQQYTVSFRRTNIPCGYYQIDIPYHDDDAFLFINGALVWQHSPGCCDAHTNVWSGFIGTSTLVEYKFINYGGPGQAEITFSNPNPLTMSTPITVCAGTNANISVANSSTVAVTYSWTPSSTVSPTTGMNVTATPTANTIYTVTATDANPTFSVNTGCAITNTLNVMVNPTPNPTMTVSYPPYSTANTYSAIATCYGLTTATLSAGGAYTYSWSPAAGLSATTGVSVIANPTITTTYTVSGSNNCTAVGVSSVVTVQTPPSTPTSTAFGSNVWNAYCHDNTTFNDYYGYYTETGLSFNTTTRWTNSLGPTTCTTTSTGQAYSGCSFGETSWSMSFRRTGVPCGYYSLDINYQDDQLKFLVNGIGTFTNTAYTPTIQTGVWAGFIGPSTTLEFQLINNGGPGQLQVTFNPIAFPVLNAPVTICAGSSANLSSNYIPGANYVWTPTVSVSPPTSYTTVASPSVTTNYTCTATDPLTTCSASASVQVTINTPNTAVTPTTGTITCPINIYTLTATGAYTYSWSPSAGLSVNTGNVVVATPTVTTTYTVVGYNNCATSNATSTITVLPLVYPNVIPSGQWNAYCYGDVNLLNYYGYYTITAANGASGFDFNTTTQWTAASGIPSNINGTNHTAYTGCTMPSSSNWAISFKRTGFACGTYSINITQVDYFYLFINGVQVAQRAATGSITESGVWTGVLNSASTVEIRYVHYTTGNPSMSVTFVPVTSPAAQSTWVGGSSTDWFTAANWCGGGGVPTYTNDVVVPAAGPQNMPIIGANGAQCKSITINPAIVAGTYNNAISSASLTTSSSFSLDVYGNWNNGGALIANNGTINMTGTSAKTMSCSTTESFYNLIINNAAGVTISSGIHQVSNNMTFTSGIVTQNATLNILNGATVTGASNSSYVSGYIIKYGTNAFTFPVGAAGNYRPASISAPSNTTDFFTCAYFNSNPFVSPYNTTTWDLGINHLSGLEYWILNRSSGGSNVNVTLSWNANSQVNTLSDLIVARYDAGLNAWKNQGNGGTTGTPSAGTIITNGVVTNFSPFTLASSTANNPLPIDLTSFNCKALNKVGVQLSWSTATETNNDYFNLERSADGLTFDILKQVKGAGNSTHTTNYQTIDSLPLPGVSYYRLKQTDFNGNFKYYEVCSVTNALNSEVSFYPNPANTSFTIDFRLSSAGVSSFSLKNSIGQDVNVPYTASSGEISVDVSRLTPGVYFVQVILGNEKVVNHKITVRR